MRRFLLLIISVIFLLPSFAQGPGLEPKQDSKKPLWGYVNPQTGKWVVKPAYNVAEPFQLCPDGKYRALVTKGNLQGYINADGKVMSPGIVFEKIQPIMKGYNLIVSVKGKKGIINPDGIYVQKPDFTSLKPLGDEGYIAEAKGKQGFLNPMGETVIPIIYTTIDPSEDGYFIVEKGGKAGLYSRDGKLILEPKDFNYISKFNDYWLVKKGDKTGLYDSKQHQLLVKANYGEVLDPVSFPGGIIFPVKKTNNKWGAVDINGKEVLKCKNQALATVPALNAIMVYRNNVGNRLWFPQYDAFVELNSWTETPYGPFRKMEGKAATPTLESPEYMIPGLSLVEYVKYGDNYEMRTKAFNSLGGNNHIMVLVDKQGHQVGNQDVKIREFGNNWLVLPSNTQNWNLYNNQGDFIKKTGIKPGTFYASTTQDWVAGNDRILFLDFQEYDFVACGNDLQFMKGDNSLWIPIVNDIPQNNVVGYEEVVAVGENSATVKNNGKWGLFTDGNLKTDCLYPTPMRTSDVEGYYEVGNSGNVGLITLQGLEVLPMQYDEISPSKRTGYLKVSQGKHLGLFNPSTKSWLFTPDRQYDRYEFIDSNADESDFWIFKGYYVGVVANNGKEIISPSYDKITRLKSLEIYECDKGGKSKYFTLNGNSYTPSPKGILSDLSHYGDRYYNGQKGEMQWVDIRAYFLKGHKIKLVCELHNANGSLHVTKGKQHYKREYHWNVDSNNFYVDDQSFFVPYNFISQGRWTDKDYYVQYKLIDETTGKVLDTGKIKFGMRRN